MSDYGTCDHHNCIEREGLEPQYTKPLTAPRTRHQPLWYCKTHRSKHPDVSPVNGVKRERQYPSYLKKEGRYVPLIRVKRGGVNAT